MERCFHNNPAMSCVACKDEEIKKLKKNKLTWNKRITNSSIQTKD
mgnify:CR=1 FL=1